jgi:hypothetical protein
MTTPTRYEVRPCKARSTRAQNGYAVNLWYIHDNETDNELERHEPTVDRHRTFKTRRSAKVALERQIQRATNI